MTINGTVLTLASLQLLSASLDFSAAMAMLYLNDVRKAMFINGLLAVIGPVIFASSIAIGMISIADELSHAKTILIVAGIILLIIGIVK